MPAKEIVSFGNVRKKRIAVELPLNSALREELYAQADRFGWQIYDLSINSFVLPSNPPPDGAIIASRGGSNREEHKNRTFPCPTVRVSHGLHALTDEYPRVLLDPYAAGRMAADYFAERSYVDIMMILRSDPDGVHPVYRGVLDRANELGMRTHCLELKERMGNKGDETRAEWTREIGDFIESLPRPLAFVGNSDRFTARVSFVCESRHISIPEDIAVLGVGNDLYVCREAPVPLSSIDPDYPSLIQQAAEILNGVMDGGPLPQNPVVVAPIGVITRRSTDMLAVRDPKVARALRFMWDHLAWPISVDDVAYEIGVSRRTLDRTFKKELGRGVNGELKRKRLEYCCELLQNSTLTVEEINREIGIKSKTYLHRIFLERYGTTPMQFRKTMKGIHSF